MPVSLFSVTISQGTSSLEWSRFFFVLYIKLLGLPGEKCMASSSCHLLLKDLDIGDIAINKGM
jgi:hypothetical protein